MGDNTPLALPAATESEGRSYTCVRLALEATSRQRSRGGVKDILAPSCPVLTTSPDAEKT